MKIFVCIESYLPGTLGGGPVRALVNLIDHLQGPYEFFVFTRNRDYLSAEAYPDIEPDVWQPRGKTCAFYTKRQDVEVVAMEQLKNIQPDWIYLNGALPPLTRSLLQLRSKAPEVRSIPILLAPHGNLSQQALSHHRFRKQAWLLYAKWRGLYDGVIWHAASARESDQVRAVFGAAAEIREVPMAPASARLSPQVCSLTCPEGTQLSHPSGKPTVHHLRATRATSDLRPQVSTLNSPPSPLRLVYFGRLSPEKNLPFAFRLLEQIAQAHPEHSVVYDLIGSGDAAYEATLRRSAAALPALVQVNFVGQLSTEALQARLQLVPAYRREAGSSDLRPPLSALQSPASALKSQALSLNYHALLMPSLTENFSYTVLESWQAGLPVLISDQTPWRDLEEEGVGWDLSLDKAQPWLDALRVLAAASPAETEARRCRVYEYAEQWASGYKEAAESLFTSAGPLEKGTH